MGTLLIALLLVGATIFILTQTSPVFSSNLKNWGKGGDYGEGGFWSQEERSWLVAGTVGCFLILFGIVGLLSRAGLVEKYDEWETQKVVSYDGNTENFVIGRCEYYYYVLSQDNGLKEVKIKKDFTTIENSGYSAEIRELVKYKAVRKSKRPFMFWTKEDDITRRDGCGCSSEQEFILAVPPNFTFKDLVN